MNRPARAQLSYLRLIYRAWRYRLALDPDEIRYLRKHVSRGDNVLDIGAHKGAYSYWLSKSVGPTGKVTAFEPQPILARYLSEMMIPQVVVENLALSSKEGQMMLTIPGAEPSPAATLEPRDRPGLGSITVPVTTLDRYLRDAQQRISFIKIDVEGHELELFKGASQIIERDRPTIMFECEQRHHKTISVADIFDWLLLKEYRGLFYDKAVQRPIAEFDLDHMQSRDGPYINNFIFVPQN